MCLAELVVAMHMHVIMGLHHAIEIALLSVDPAVYTDNIAADDRLHTVRNVLWYRSLNYVPHSIIRLLSMSPVPVYIVPSRSTV